MTKNQLTAAGIIGILILTVISLGVFGLIPGLQNSQNERGDTLDTTTRIFKDHLVARGVAEVGQPIEGFDASLLMDAFPGLTPEDFSGVEAFEGTYAYANGELTFNPDAEEPHTSAAQTIADEGYKTLFDNVSARLETTISGEEAVDELIDTLGGWSGIPPQEQWETTTAAGLTFDYPAELSAEYIEFFDWPPQVEVLDETYTCTESGGISARAGGTEERVVSGESYCVTQILEGAAGSVYSQYAYAFAHQSETAIFTFSTRLPQCDNFDQPQSGVCQGERTSFNPDQLIHTIIQTMR